MLSSHKNPVSNRKLDNPCSFKILSGQYQKAHHVQLLRYIFTVELLVQFNNILCLQILFTFQDFTDSSDITIFVVVTTMINT
jgi:hypothetical protein